MACYLVRVMKRSIAASERQFAEAPVFALPGRCYAGAYAIGSPYPHYVWEGYPKQRTASIFHRRRSGRVCHSVHGLKAGHGIAGHKITTADSRNAEPARSDRKSTRLNSSHTVISYAVFCLKQKK